MKTLGDKEPRDGAFRRSNGSKFKAVGARKLKLVKRVLTKIFLLHFGFFFIFFLAFHERTGGCEMVPLHSDRKN